MFTEKAIRIHILGRSDTLDRGKETQAITSGGLIDIGVVQAAPGRRLPVGDYEGYGGGIAEVKAEGLRDRNRQQAYGLVAVYIENCEG